MGTVEAADDQEYEYEYEEQVLLPVADPSSEPNKSPAVQVEMKVVRTGTRRTAVAHIITGVIGAGVLSLAWSIAQLGWLAGPLSVVAFASVTNVSTSLLCDCYRPIHPSSSSSSSAAVVNRSYFLAVRHFLGGKNESICGVLVHMSLYGTAIAYTITAAVSFRAIQTSICYHREGREAAACSNYGDEMYMLLFGCVQIIVSQVPGLHDMAWLSVLATLMSFAYSTVGLALGATRVIGNRTIKGSIGGAPASSTLRKGSLVFEALGDIAFAYPYAVITLEIQDTLKSPPPEKETMKEASMFAILITTFFYLSCGCFGYAAFGNDTPGNILTGFYEPYWLIAFANACIVIHLIGGYQVYSQALFATVERGLADKFPSSGFVKDFHAVKLPLLPKVRVNLMRLCVRTAFVTSTTGIAMLFPYFNQVLGVLGAFSFWPLGIYFPVEMYCVQNKIRAWTTKGVLLRSFSAVCLLVSIIALVGSVEGIVRARLRW